MGKLIKEEPEKGRLHIDTPLMGESLVSRQLLEKTESEDWFRMHPDMNVVKIGGQSIMDRGARALLPTLDELTKAKDAHKILLMALGQRPSYGYELIQQLAQFGFVKDQPPPGMIYRHLRDLEENGLVSSQWETGGSGPAKRVYHLTPEGEAVLGLWVGHMQEQAEKLLEFIEACRRLEDTSNG